MHRRHGGWGRVREAPSLKAGARLFHGKLPERRNFSRRPAASARRQRRRLAHPEVRPALREHPETLLRKGWRLGSDQSLRRGPGVESRRARHGRGGPVHRPRRAVPPGQRDGHALVQR